jgi:uncharacterized protein YdeI (BOF family)
MTSWIRIGMIVGLTLLTSALAASAWKGGPGGAMPIAEAMSQAESGDYFVVEGVVIDTKSKELYRIRDDSGTMLIRIPDFVRRESGVPKKNEKIRVSGRFDSKKLDSSTQGMRVQQLYRLGLVSGAQGAASSAGTTRPVTPTPTLTPTPTPPAAPSTGTTKKQVLQPTAGRELVEQIGAARRELAAARDELREANVAYGRALHAAGDHGSMDSAIAEREVQAEQRVRDAEKSLEPLFEKARAAGVPDSLIDAQGFEKQGY